MSPPSPPRWSDEDASAVATELKRRQQAVLSHGEIWTSEAEAGSTSCGLVRGLRSI